MRWVVTLLALAGCALSAHALLPLPLRCSTNACPTSTAIPLLGVAYFSLVLWLAALNFPLLRLRPLCLAAAMASIGFLIGLMWRQLRCTPCLLTHVTNFLLLLAVLPARRPRAAHRPDPLKPLLALVLALLTTTAIGLAAKARRSAPVSLDAVATLNMFYQRPQHPELLDPTGHTLVMFTDLTCDICQKVDEMLHERTLPTLDNKVRLIYKNYPICTDCNPGLPKNLHPGACAAADLAEAARRLKGQPGFDTVKSAIPAGMDHVTPALLTSIAATLRVGPQDLLRQARSPEVQQTIANDIHLADQLHVDGTPTLYLDGREVLWTELGNEAFLQAWLDRNP